MTSKVCGDFEIRPQLEGYWGATKPIGLRSCDDAGKRRAETLFFNCWNRQGLRIKVAQMQGVRWRWR